jgi:hypothetical protein
MEPEEVRRRMDPEIDNKPLEPDEHRRAAVDDQDVEGHVFVTGTPGESAKRMEPEGAKRMEPEGARRMDTEG